MRTIFWNVDTQYDFMRDDESFKGALAVPGARAIEDNLGRITQYARSRGITVVNTADWHTPDSAEFSDKPDFVRTFPPHCLQGTRGAQYVPATEPLDACTIDWRDPAFDTREMNARRSIVLYKDAFDAFAGNPHTEAVVRALNPKRAVVYGVATNYCVQYAVQGLLERGIDVLVVSDAIKEIPNCDIGAFIDREWRAKGVRFTTTKGLDAAIRAGDS